MKIKTRGGFIDRQQKGVEVVTGGNRRSFPSFSFIFSLALCAGSRRFVLALGVLSIE